MIGWVKDSPKTTFWTCKQVISDIIFFESSCYSLTTQKYRERSNST